MSDLAAAPPLPSFRCASCGDAATYAPGTDRLRCASCGAEVPIAAGDTPVVEEDLTRTLASLQGAAEVEAEDRIVFRCGGCGAETTLPDGVTAGACAFCGSAVVGASRSVRALRPAALLPFRVGRDEARARFRAWIRSRWLAPGDLRRWADRADTLLGVYLPHWTFDAATETSYVGQRGDHYTVTVGSGKKRRTEVRTRWTPAWGKVSVAFDDLLVPAGGSLPPVLTAELAPWDLKEVVPYADGYLSGFRAESYRIGLKEAFGLAEASMRTRIEAAVRQDIGGNVQQIWRMEIRKERLTFKHLLLPIWACSYRYRDRVFPILVNARTGEVQGKRPWSAWKIATLVLAVAAAVAVVALVQASR
jgi:DNA-directed RNA polymerase subunit RPC12/RpoP